MEENNLNLFINDFTKVKKMGFVKSRRKNNTGIGKTYEDLLMIAENNNQKPDLHGFEIKTQRNYSESMITLFSKKISEPKRANQKIKDLYGYPHAEFDNINVLHVSIYSKKPTFPKNGNIGFQLKINEKDEKIYIQILKKNNKGKINVISNEYFYHFEHLKKALNKIQNLAYVKAETKKDSEDNELFYFDNAIIFSQFISFDNFIKQIKKGNIVYEMRMGAYKTGKKKGKVHDHGSGFRIKKDNLKSLYKNFKLLD